MITVIPDISLVYQMINLPIRNVLLERKAKIEGMKIGAQKAASDLVAGEDAYKDGLKQARSKGLKEKKTFIEEASKEEKEIIDRINKKAQANLAQIKKQVADETEQARKTLEGEVDAYAKAIGGKILGRAC